MTVPAEEHTPSPHEARGIYGFVLYLFLKISIICYFIWMFLPLSFIEKLPYAPPQQYWGLAVPVFFCTSLFVFAFYLYPALHGLHDCKFDEPSAITDPDSHSEDYFEIEKARAKAKNAKEPKFHRKKKKSEGSPLKAMKASAVYEKSRTLSAKEKKYKEMQILYPIRSFPESDTNPIPPPCDLDLDMVCKKIFLEQ